MNNQQAIQLITQKIYDKYGKENIENLHIEQNNDYHGNYFAWWVILEQNHRIEYRQYYNI